MSHELNEAELRAEFERQHKGRDLQQHRMRGTYIHAQIAAIWNQHKRTAEWMAGRSPAPAAQQAGSEHTVDDSDLARKIMLFLGMATAGSMEPGADQLRDRLAEKLAVWRPADVSAPAEAARTRIAGADDLAAQDAAREAETTRLAKQYVDRQAEAASVREPLKEAHEIIDNLSSNILQRGNYSQTATLTFLDQLRMCITEAIRALQGKPGAAKGGES